MSCTARQTAKFLFTPVSMRREAFGAIDTFSAFYGALSFSVILDWVISPLKSCRTRFGTALLFAAVVVARGVKGFHTPCADPFFKSEVCAPSVPIVKFPVFFRIYKAEVFNSIVCFNFIYMVNVFIRAQFAAKEFGHNISVFKGLRGPFKHGVLGCIYKNIPRSVYSFSSGPIGMVFSGIHSLADAVASYNPSLHLMMIGPFRSEVK